MTAASSGTHTHTLVQKTGVSPVRRHWRAQQRDVSITEGGRGDTGRGLRDDGGAENERQVESSRLSTILFGFLIRNYLAGQRPW